MQSKGRMKVFWVDASFLAGEDLQDVTIHPEILREHFWGDLKAEYLLNRCLGLSRLRIWTGRRLFHPVLIGHLTNTKISKVTSLETPQIQDVPEEFFFYTDPRLRMEICDARSASR